MFYLFYLFFYIADNGISTNVKEDDVNEDDVKYVQEEESGHQCDKGLECPLLLDTVSKQTIERPGARRVRVKRFPITYKVVGEPGIRDLNFSRGQHIEGGAHLLSLAALNSMTLKRAGTHLQLGEL